MSTDQGTRRRRWAVPGWLAVLVALASVSRAADPAGIDRVWFPSARVPALFPPGSELRVLPFAEFDDLARRAAIAAQKGKSPEPRLVRVRHAARWEDGVLTGRTELVATPVVDGPERLLAVEPWSPAVSGSTPGGRIRVGADGRLAVRVGPGPTEPVVMDWRLRARPGSEGSQFALGLPELDVATLALELPRGLIPVLDRGPKLEASPASGSDRVLWTGASVRGRVNLRLRRAGQDQVPAGCWVEGAVRVDLNESPVVWRGDWTVIRPAGASGSLVIDLDSGLEPMDVTGPRIASFRAEPRGNTTRVVVTLTEDGPGTFSLGLRAAVRVPVEGAWTIPGARFVGAVRTGERTLVSIDPGRVVAACTERQGRQVPARPDDPADPNRLVFESTRPGPVADLVFRRPVPETTVEIRGLLRLGLDLPRLEATTTWTLAPKSPAPEFAISLPPGWTPRRLTRPDGSPVAWRTVAEPDGGTRVVADPTAVGEPTRPLPLTLSAIAAAPITPGAGGLDLPRLGRPGPGVIIADEVWTAVVDPGVTLHPIAASGLAWIDPPGATPPDPAGTDRRDELRAGAGLAWRWLGGTEAHARVERTLDPWPAQGDLRTEVTLTGGLLRVEWTIRLDVRGEPIQSLALHGEGGVDSHLPWHADDPTGPTLTNGSLDPAARAGADFPADGDAWTLRFSRPVWGPLTLRAQLERPWPGRGAVPILSLPRSLRPRSLVAVNVEPATRLRVESTGFESIDPDARPSADRTEAPSGSSHRAALLVRTGPRAAIQLAVEPGQVEPDGGLIREATLRTEFPGRGEARHWLDLRIAVDTARSLELTLPPGVIVDRLRRDGQDVAASTSGRALVVALPAPTPARPTCGITLDYRTDEPPRSDRLAAGSVLPSCPFPCLSFAWEIAAPHPWSVRSVDPDLVPIRTPVPPSWSARWLGLNGAWPTGNRREPANRAESMITDLDQAATAITADSISLGDYLTRLDAGRWPVVVDRLALANVGVGPATRLTREAGPVTVSVALADLRLVLVPVGGIALITARDAGAGSADDEGRVRRAASERSDPADRYQSALRWRGEATPRALAVGETPRALVAAPGWEVHRFVAVNWPLPGGSRVAFTDTRRAESLGWLVAGSVVAAGIVARRRAFRTRAVLMAVIGLVASGLVAWSWPEPSAVGTGLIRGGLGLLAWWAGVRPRRPRTTGPSDDATWISRRADQGSTRLAAAGTILILVTWTGALGREVGPGARPILAVFPYDGPAPDPGRVPDRVVMLLTDFERLTRLAQPDAVPPVTVSLVAARHEVRRDGPGRAAVDSRFDLWVDGTGTGTGTWLLPVGPARDLQVEVDGRPGGLWFLADGAEAQVVVGGAGPHTVRFRRWVPVAPGTGGDGEIRVPINRAAFTRVLVAGRDDSARVELPDAAAEPGQVADGIEAMLGPEATLLVRWAGSAEARGELAPTRYQTEALWDLCPAGDRVRVRLSHDQSNGLGSLRLGLAPDAAVREVAIHNLVEAHREGTAGRSEWVAQIDPPWPAGTPIEIELWHPAGRDAARHVPRVTPTGEARVAGAIFVRRPADWSGGLTDPAGLQTWSEIAPASPLERAGDAPLVAVGVGRFDGRWPDLVSTVRPARDRVEARTSAVISPRTGRLDAVLETTLTAVGPERRAFGVVLPEGFRTLAVEADGLTGWQAVEPRRLTLRFDGPEARQRVVRIRGDVPTPPSDLLGDPAATDTRVPWPVWDDAADLGGTIEVAGATRVILPDDGGTVAASPALSTGGSPGRSLFRVRPSGQLPAIRWLPPATRVDATIESNVTLFPTSMAWNATIRCDLAGGPARALTWTVPTAWTRGAVVEARDRPVRVDAEEDGDLTRWTITPDEPWWNRAELALRAVLKLEPGREWKFPDLAPLAQPGRGKVRRYTVAVVNASGQSIEMAGSPGLREGDAARFRVEDSPLPTGPADRVFQVSGDQWALRVVVGRDSGAVRPLGERETARVTQAELDVAIDASGRGAGRAVYQLDRGPALFLPIRLSRGGLIPWASVDGRIVAPIHAGEDRWSIPLGSPRARQVCFTWTVPGGPSGSDLVLPATEQDDVPALVGIAAPDSVNLTTGQGRFWRIAAPTWDVEAAERIATRVVESLATFDRDSAADRDALVADLGRFEQHARGLNRARAAESNAERAAHDARFGRLDAARTLIADAILDNGLEDLAQVPTARPGPAGDPQLASAEVAAEVADVTRPRHVGSMTFYRGTGPSFAHPSSLVWSVARAPWPDVDGERWLVLALGLAATVALTRLVDRIGVPTTGRRRSLAVAVGLGVVLAAWTPVLGAGSFGLGMAGRLIRPRDGL